MKRGRISKEEESFIEANMGVMSVLEISEELDRDPVSLQQFIKRKFKVGLSDEEEAAFDLASANTTTSSLSSESPPGVSEGVRS